MEKVVRGHVLLEMENVFRFTALIDQTSQWVSELLGKYSMLTPFLTNSRSYIQVGEKRINIANGEDAMLMSGRALLILLDDGVKLSNALYAALEELDPEALMESQWKELLTRHNVVGTLRSCRREIPRVKGIFITYTGRRIAFVAQPGQTVKEILEEFHISDKDVAIRVSGRKANRPLGPESYVEITALVESMEISNELTAVIKAVGQIDVTELGRSIEAEVGITFSKPRTLEPETRTDVPLVSPFPLPLIYEDDRLCAALALRQCKRFL